METLFGLFVFLKPEPGTEDGDRFEVLLMLIEAYEEKHYPIGPSDPIDAI